MGNCHRTGSHFHLPMDYNGVAFSKDLRMRVGKGGEGEGEGPDPVIRTNIRNFHASLI